MHCSVTSVEYEVQILHLLLLVLLLILIPGLGKQEVDCGKKKLNAELMVPMRTARELI